jgi:hypothetical protein
MHLDKEHKTNIILLKTGGNKIDRVDKPFQRDRVKPFVEVPSKRRSSKLNLIKSLFKSWFPVRLRKRPPFGTPVMSQRITIHAGSLG